MKKVFRTSALVLASGMIAASGAAFAGPSQTQDSALLQKLEERANSASASKKIVVLDYDAHLMTLLGQSELLRFSLKKQFEEKGVAASMDNLSSFRSIMGGIESFHPAFMGEASMTFVDDKGVKICAVVPSTPDLSSLSSAQGYFNLQAGVSMDINFSPRAQTMRGTYQALWRCLDEKYQPAVDSFADQEKDPMGYSHARHKSEMFSEVAAALELAASGETHIIQQQADLRSLRSATAGPRFAKMFNRKMDYEFYDGALFYLTPALDALAKHIEQEGLDKVKAYTTEDIRRVAAEITEKHALTRNQYRAINDYHVTKSYPAGDAFMKSVVARLHEAEGRTGTKPSSFVLPPPSTGDYKTTYADKFVEAQPAEDRKSLQDDFRWRIGNGDAPEKALSAMLDILRTELHNAPTRDKAEGAEKKIALLRGMAETGNLREIVYARSSAPAGPQAASAPSR